MTTDTTELTTSVRERRALFRSDATQKLLAFAGLIALFVVFSLASPNFFKFDNISVFAGDSGERRAGFR